MSLETTYKALRSIPIKIPLWKFALYTSILPALFSVGLVSFLLNFDKISPLQIPVIELSLFAVLAIAFLTTSMISVLSGIGLAFVLIKIRDRYYVKNGEIIGNSLATNNEFLHKLAKGLFPYLIDFIKSHNDPKFEAQDTRILELENNQKPTPNELDYNRIIADQRRIIFEQKDLITKQKEIIAKLLPEQSKAETEEKDAQIIKKDNRFESV